MISQELLDFIKKEKLKGTSDIDIKSILLKNNWTLDDINEAYNSINVINNPNTTTQTLITPSKNKSKRLSYLIIGILAYLLMFFLFSINDKFGLKGDSLDLFSIGKYAFHFLVYIIFLNLIFFKLIKKWLIFKLKINNDSVIINYNILLCVSVISFYLAFYSLFIYAAIAVIIYTYISCSGGQSCSF